MQRFSCSWERAFSSPEAALLLVSTKNRDLWPGPTPEVLDSRTSAVTLRMVLVSIYCVYKVIQNRNVVGPGQRSWFLVLTKKSAASGDENGGKALAIPWLLCQPTKKRGISHELTSREPFIRALPVYINISRACINATSFPGPFPWFGGGSGKGPGIGWSRVYLTPWNPGCNKLAS